MSTFARFLLVGGALAALYALLAALATSQLPWPKAVSAAVAWLACIPLGFWCHRRFTFPGSARRPFALALYAATQLIGIGIGAGMSYLFATGSFWLAMAWLLPVVVLVDSAEADREHAVERWMDELRAIELRQAFDDAQQERGA